MRDDEAARLLDLLEERASDSARAAEEPAALAEAEHGLRILEEAGEVPDPGALFWRRFGERVLERVPRRRAAHGRWWIAAAAAALALSVTLLQPPAPPGGAGWRPLPEDDAALEVLAGLGDEAEALAPETACAVEECLLDLDDVESRRLATLLREEMEGREL